MKRWVFVLLVCMLGVAVSDDEAPPTPAPAPETTPDPFIPQPPENASPCSNMPPVAPGGPALPELPKQFQAHVEAKISQEDSEDYTMDIMEYYDLDAKKGALHKTEKGTTSIWIYNFETSESFKIQDSECVTSKLNEEDGSKFSFFNFTLGNTGGSIGGAMDLFNFGTMFNEIFVSGNETVRGIPVNQWASCVEWNNIIYKLDYYFSKGDYQMPTGKAAVPVRAVINGTTKNAQSTNQVKFENVYDFTCFTQGPVEDCTVFEIPQGSVCERINGQDVPAPTHPKLADRFSMTTEIIWPSKKTISVTKQYFDFDLKLCRLDITPSDTGNTMYGPEYGGHPLSLIMDFHTRLQYVIDREQKNCSIKEIDDQNPFGVLENQTLLMKHGDQLFSLDHLTLAPQGTRNVRGIETDVWAAQSKEDSTLYEFYFAKEGWFSGSELSSANVDRALVGMWVGSAQNGSQDYVNHVVDYLNQEPLLSAFDIDICFDLRSQMKHFRIQVKGTYDDVVTGKRQFLQPAVRKTIAAAAAIDEIRISRIEFEQTEDDAVDIWMTMLALPSEDIGDLPTSVSMVPLEIAYDNLESTLKEQGDSFVIPVSTGTGTKNLAVIEKSLKTDREVLDPRVPASSSKGGHSSASMGALGFFMLLIGVGCGLIAGFVLWKRNTGIPYMVQH